MTTGLEKSRTVGEHEQAIRDTLERRGFNADALMKDARLDVTEDGALVLDLGPDPVKRAVELLTSGRPKPESVPGPDHFERIRKKVRAEAAARSTTASYRARLGMKP